MTVTQEIYRKCVKYTKGDRHRGARAEYGRKILTTLATQLSWSHFIEILPLETDKARLYYAHEAATRHLGTKELRRQISRKSYERREIANVQIKETSKIPFNIFKDPLLAAGTGGLNFWLILFLIQLLA